MGLEIFFLYTAYHNANQHELSEEQKRRRDRRTKRVALRYYKKSSFFYLFNSGDDQSLLNCCAVDHRVFHSLLEVFEPIFDEHMVNEHTGCIWKLKLSRDGIRKGRKRQVDATCCLAMRLRTVTRPVSTHHRVLSPHL